MSVPLVRCATAEEAVTRAADHVVATLRDAIAARGEAWLALSGGSTPRRLYEALVRRRDALDWNAVHYWWSDERVVPPDHDASNVRMARESLLEPLRVDEGRIHAPRTELGPADAATHYEIELRTVSGETTPAFDLALLGMGDDGHTASLFPDGPELDVPDSRLVVASTAPFDPPERITFTLPLIDAARAVAFLVVGDAKAEPLGRVIADDRTLPAARVRPSSGGLVWFVDAAAVGA